MRLLLPQDGPSLAFWAGSWRQRLSGGAATFRDGLLVALFAACWWHLVSATLGSSLVVDLAICWALSMGAWLGASGDGRIAWLHLGLAAWSGLLGLLLSVMGWGLAQLELGQLGIADGLPAALLATTLLLSIPAGWAVRLAVVSTQHHRSSGAGFLAGAGSGLLLVGLWLFGWLGVGGTLLLAASASGLVFLWHLALGTSGDHSTATSPLVLLRPVMAVVVVLAGVVLACQLRLLAQLVPPSQRFVLCAAAALCWGLALGRVFKVGDAGRAWLAATWLVPAALFCHLVDGLLAVKAWESRPETLLGLQALLVIAVILPTGWLLAGGWSGRDGGVLQESPRSLPAGLAPVLLSAGLFAGRWPLLVHFGVVPVLLASAWCVCGLLGLTVVRQQGHRWRHAVLALTVLLVGSLLSGGYQPAHSARLLYAANVTIAARAGWPTDLLTAIDDGRLVRQVETGQGTLTAWRHRGVQLWLRLNGIPGGVLSTDPAICPSDPPAVLGAVLPLVFHERPARVMLLGLSGGVGLETCRRFPVESIDCIEPDRQLFPALAALRLDTEETEAVSDGRVRLLHLPAALALRARSGRYDLIIAPAVPAVAWEAEATRTVEFYRRAAGQLAAEGIFCQAIVADDLDLATVATLQRSLAEAFRTTVLVHVGPTRFLVLGTNATAGLIRPGLVGRLQAPHVRATLAEIGWDWADVLRVGIVEEGWEQQRGRINTIRDGRLAARMPEVVLQGGGDRADWLRILGPVTRPLLGWIPKDDEQFVAVRDRLADLRKRSSLLARASKSFHSYRRVLKRRLYNKPRHVLESRSGKGLSRVVHRDDRLRRQYFRTLDQVMGETTPSIDMIRRVTAFLDPYDPLLVEFIHREAAELWSRRGESGREMSLRHRLHVIHFGSRADLGVEEIHAAAALLTAPRALGEDIGVRRAEWDQLNGLLEVLNRRWSLKLPRLSEASELSAGLEVIGRISDRMTDLARSDPVLQAAWQLRKAAMQRLLVSPMRHRRARLNARGFSHRLLGN